MLPIAITWRGALFAAGLCAAVPMDAQHTAKANREIARRVPATVFLVDTLPHARAAAVIVRRKNAVNPDLILLPSATANAELLVTAVINLLIIRETAGDTASVDGIFKVDKYAVSKGVLRRETAAANGVMALLRASTPQAVPGIGSVKARVIYLPSAETRGRLRAAGRWISRQGVR